MPISSIIQQPATDSINAAYRPVILSVTATKTDNSPVPDVVYCDIYINNIYYRTNAKTHPSLRSNTNSTWTFDVQRECQELLTKQIADNGQGTIGFAPGPFTIVFCRFRSSGVDSEGLLLPEGVQPIQGTGSTSPVPGSGLQSNSFFVLNATLQHEQNQILSAHLSFFKYGQWSPLAWPLTHRPPIYKISFADSDAYPIFYTGLRTLDKIRINYRNLRGQPFTSLTASTFAEGLPAGSTKGVFLIPNGPKNLIALFPNLNFRNIYEYNIQVIDDLNNIVCETTLNKIEVCNGERIFFLNDLGVFDAFNFLKASKIHEDKSSTLTTPLGNPFQKKDGGTRRAGITAIERYELKTNASEEEIIWLNELSRSAILYLNFNGIESQPDDYIPVEKIGGKLNYQKNINDFFYQVEIEVQLSNSKITIRN